MGMAGKFDGQTANYTGCVDYLYYNIILTQKVHLV